VSLVNILNKIKHKISYFRQRKMALINDFLSLIYPRFCEACNELLYKHESLICNKCIVTLPKSHFHKDPNNPIYQALGGRILLQNATSLFVFEKEGKVQALLHALKYDNQQALGVLLGELLFKDIQHSGFFESVDVIVPVPLHKNKLQLRGYNQSECFAKGIAQAADMALDHTTLIREQETSTQTKKKKYERWENVKNVFALTSAEAFENKHILLVDDVITTGATIEAAWQALKDVKGIRVSLASIAFANK
jgi:ComF family protein